MKLDRAKNLERMRRERFDLIVIGGGITGAGVARDAASRGLTVALIEADDFASGTSSRSSKLIHGGIRYLENLEFGLVFEALRERRNLFDMAPHLVHPLRFMLPLYKDSRVGMFKMGLGMMLYDALSMFEAPELHERLTRHESVERVSILNREGLMGSYVYSDAYMDDDRLVVETLRSAHHFGAVIASYVRAVGAIYDESRQNLLGVQCRDEVSGEKFELKARHIISTVGPWTDDVAKLLVHDWRKILRPSKGIHLTLRRDRLKLPEAVVMAADDEKRIVFAIPRHEMIIVGTTDTDYSGDPRDVHTERADVNYLLHILHDYFPGAMLTEDDILASYSGIRPLVHDSAATESGTSREHVIISLPQGLTLVAGGKYTTYRKMAEDTVVAALEFFTFEEKVRYGKGNTIVPLNPLVTADSLLRASLFAADWAKASGIDVDTVNFLAERHGSEALEILGRYKLPNIKNARWHLEALHAIDQTMCFHLRDFYLRRVPLFLARADHGFLLINELADTFQARLGWSDSVKKSEIEAVRQHLLHEMGWRIDTRATPIGEANA